MVPRQSERLSALASRNVATVSTAEAPMTMGLRRPPTVSVPSLPVQAAFHGRLARTAARPTGHQRAQHATVSATEVASITVRFRRSPRQPAKPMGRAAPGAKVTTKGSVPPTRPRAVAQLALGVPRRPSRAAGTELRAPARVPPARIRAATSLGTREPSPTTVATALMRSAQEAGAATVPRSTAPIAERMGAATLGSGAVPSRAATVGLAAVSTVRPVLAAVVTQSCATTTVSSTRIVPAATRLTTGATAIPAVPGPPTVAGVAIAAARRTTIVT